ncbi:MAG: DUF4124 domain-containing protein [Wenzhouxiangella sp.]
MIRALLTLLLTMGLFSQVLAQVVYRWTDHDGRVHLGHAVPPEYRSLGFERLAADGRVLEVVPPELTAEERAAERQQRRLQAALQAEQESQAARDRLLLAAYRNEQELIETRDLRLDALMQQRRALETSHRHSVQRFEDLVARAAELNRQSQNVPTHLQNSISETQNEVRRLRDAMSDMDERMTELHKRFEVDLERYRSLTQRGE